MAKKFDVDPHALAEELSLSLKKERARPKKHQRSFREIAAALYRSRDIRGDLWGEYNSAIGKILAARPRKQPTKVTPVETKKPAFDMRAKTLELLFLGQKYQTQSFFTPEGTLVVDMPGAELYYRVVLGKVKQFGGRHTFDHGKKVSKVLQSVGLSVAKARFTEKVSPQAELAL